VQLARAQGDFLLVGLHTDDDVMERRGAHLPIMDLHERALSVLACCFVNEVIIGQCLLAPQTSSPWRQTRDKKGPVASSIAARSCACGGPAVSTLLSCAGA